MIISELNPSQEDYTFRRATFIQHNGSFFIIDSYGSDSKPVKEDRYYITEVYKIFPELHSGNPLDWDRDKPIYERGLPLPQDSELADEMHDYAVSLYSK